MNTFVWKNWWLTPSFAEHLAAHKDKSQPHLEKPRYVTMNIPKSEEPLPDDIVSKLQVFNRLFMFGHYYLQEISPKNVKLPWLSDVPDEIWFKIKH